MPRPEGLRAALGQVIADQRREWRRERELIEAQSREAIAGLRARIVELEAELRGKVDSAIGQIPVPKDGASVTIEQLAPMVEEVVGRAVAALPPAKDGEPGGSVTLEDVRPMIGEAAASAATRATEEAMSGVPAAIDDAVAKAVAALPVPEAGKDGKSVTLEDVAPLVEEVVARAVAALPPAKEGPPGKLPLVEDWTDRVYLESEVAAHEGATWQALRNTGKAPPHADWRCLARAGRDGVDGRSLNLRETWSADETYARLDVVALDGGAFVARRDDPGPCPGPGWQLIAMRGKPGQKSTIKGDPGAKGDPGPAVVDISIDDTGMVTLTNADGSTVERDFAPVLSRLVR